jgi:uroporphyrinogen decarboxylase
MDLIPRERITLALNHREADRVAIHDGPWATTIERWQKEGMPADVTPNEYFHYEMEMIRPINTILFPARVIEDTDEYEMGVNGQGAYYKKWKTKTSTPQYLDFTIKDRKTWEEYKPNQKIMDGRVPPDFLDFCRRKRSEGQFVMFANGMGYDHTQGIVGSENLLIAMAEDPDWVRDMFEASASLIIDSAEYMMGMGFEFDGAFIFDDMGYRNTSLFSPTMYRELLFPSHKKVFDFFHSKGLKVVMHSCGCIKELVPMLIEAGLDCLQPLEVKAGMDLIEMKKLYGEKLALMGGLDARKISGPEDVLEEEVRTKVMFAKQGGGYIFQSDHSVPDVVSLAHYKKFVEFGMKYGRY